MQTSEIEDVSNELPDPLKNPHQVWLYLRQLGYSCSKSQPTRDINTFKLAPLPKGGGFSKEAVRRYAISCKLRRKTYVAENDAVSIPDHTENLDSEAGREKVAQQARLARLQADKIELALEREKGNLVPAADLAITLASFAAVVEHELKNSLRTQAGKIIALVGGNAQRKAVLSRVLMDAVDGGLRHAASIEEYRVQFESLGGQ